MFFQMKNAGKDLLDSLHRERDERIFFQVLQGQLHDGAVEVSGGLLGQSIIDLLGSQTAAVDWRQPPHRPGGQFDFFHGFALQIDLQKTAAISRLVETGPFWGTRSTSHFQPLSQRDDNGQSDIVKMVEVDDASISGSAVR
jgi:hypothetical protein